MNEPLSVLIVDDDEDDYFILSEYLKEIPNKKIELTWAPTFSEAKELLSTQSFTICFFDYLLGIKTGLDLVEVAANLKLETPIILLTGKSNDEIDHQALQLGVADYMEKSEIDSRKLDRSIRYALERLSSMKSLQESEAKYKSIFSGSLDALCILSMEGQFIDANPVTLELLNLDLEPLRKKQITDFFLEKEDIQFFRDKLLKKETIPEWELKVRDSMGTVYDCFLACTWISFTPNPKDSFFRCILRNITNRKRMEQQIMAAEKLAATGRFMRMLGHEIRNPLNNIHLAATQLQEEIEDEDLYYFIDIIERNSSRINQLVTELLQSTGVQSQINREPIQLKSLLEHTISLASDKLTLKEIELHTSYEQDDVVIITDAAKLSIALLNIIVNAIEVLELGKGKLSISCQHQSHGVMIRITDNGPGIEPHLFERIFEPYFTAKQNGVGLGLSSTKSIIEALHGTIEVSSIPHQQTTFSIWLPQEAKE